MVQLRIVSRSHDKIRLFDTNSKSTSSSIGNVEGLLGIELGMCRQLLGIELRKSNSSSIGKVEGLLGIELGMCVNNVGSSVVTASFQGLH